MAASTIDLAADSYTYADLEALPDDERSRYELSHGALVVTPAPNTLHQLVMGVVVGFLLSHKLPSQRVLPESELLLGPSLVKRPDVQVVDEHLVGGQSVVGIPSLVVEIHSPATALLDRTEKRSVYQQAGVPAYWLIDPDTMTLTVLELNAEGVYEELSPAGPQGLIEVSHPCTMTLEPVRMVQGR